MVRVVPVVLYAVIATLITIRMTYYYIKHYKEIHMGYPVAILVIFTILILMNSIPVPRILGQGFIDFWADVSNGGYIVDVYYGFLTPLGLALLTLKLYCTANLIVWIAYWIIRFAKKKPEKEKPGKSKSEQVAERKQNTKKRKNLPVIGEDFSFITDAMPEDSIMMIDGIRIEIINNTGKIIPEGKKRIYARRLNNHIQLDSKTDKIQPDEKIPYIEIWNIESID